MEHPEDFVVVEEEPVGSTEQALNRLYVLIDLFCKSTDAVNQSNILLKDELRLALDVTLEHIRPEEAPNCAELVNAFETKLTGTEDIRRNYMKHLLSRLVSANSENQEYQREIADLKQALNSHSDLLTQKIADAFSSLKSIQTMVRKFETSSSVGDVTIEGATAAYLDSTDAELPNEAHVKYDDHEDKFGDNGEHDSLLTHTLDGLCDGLADVQKRIANLSRVSGGSFGVHSRRETQGTTNVETSSFFTVDEDMLSHRSADLLTPDSNTVVRNNEINLSPYDNHQPSQSSSDVHSSLRKSSATAAPFLVAAVSGGQTLETPDTLSKSVHTCTEVQSTVATSEAACQWVDTPPTRLVSGGEPLPDASNSNTCLSSPSDAATLRLHSNINEILLSPIFVPIGGMVRRAIKVTRDHVINNLLQDRELGATRHDPLPNFSAEEEDPWCPCCCQRFASREELEDHLFNCLT